MYYNKPRAHVLAHSDQVAPELCVATTCFLKCQRCFNESLQLLVNALKCNPLYELNVVVQHAHHSGLRGITRWARIPGGDVYTCVVCDGSAALSFKLLQSALKHEPYLALSLSLPQCLYLFHYSVVTSVAPQTLLYYRWPPSGVVCSKEL